MRPFFGARFDPGPRAPRELAIVNKSLIKSMSIFV